MPVRGAINISRDFFKLSRESNPEHLAFHASLQTIKPVGSKYQDSLKFSLQVASDNPNLHDSVVFLSSVGEVDYL